MTKPKKPTPKQAAKEPTKAERAKELAALVEAAFEFAKEHDLAFCGIACESTDLPKVDVCGAIHGMSKGHIAQYIAQF